MAGKFGSYKLAEAIQSIMTMANFSGYIKQEAGDDLRQFDVSSIDGNEETAVLRFEFAGQTYKAVISHDNEQ